MSETRRNVAVPFGTMHATVVDGRLTRLRFGAADETGGDNGLIDELCAQLHAFFEGERDAFDLPIVLSGTRFQEQVWAQLGRIAYGQTITYGELARWVGSPGASRAVGAANGQNPLPLIIPCHRVVAAGGKLGGYSGGGPGVKTFLLEHEAAVAGRVPAFA